MRERRIDEEKESVRHTENEKEELSIQRETEERAVGLWVGHLIWAWNDAHVAGFVSGSEQCESLIKVCACV